MLLSHTKALGTEKRNNMFQRHPQQILFLFPPSVMTSYEELEMAKLCEVWVGLNSY